MTRLFLFGLEPNSDRTRHVEKMSNRFVSSILDLGWPLEKKHSEFFHQNIPSYQRAKVAVIKYKVSLIDHEGQPVYRYIEFQHDGIRKG